MACSDNTIRAGLTPKFKVIHIPYSIRTSCCTSLCSTEMCHFQDIPTLISNMDYKMGPPPIFKEQIAGDGLKLYAPPVPEFAVNEITVCTYVLVVRMLIFFVSLFRNVKLFLLYPHPHF